MKKFYLEKITVPRWVILLIDFFINVFCFALAYFIIKQFQFPEILRGHFFIYTVFYSLIVLSVFFIMRIHTGIIRYSNIGELFRIFFAVTTTSVIYYIATREVVARFYHIQSLHVIRLLIVNFFIASSMLIMLRIVVRAFYFSIKKTSVGFKEKVLIYGSGSSSILIKQALEASNKERFDIIGFIDTGTSSINSYIQQKKIFSFKSLLKLNQKHKIDKLIVENSELNDEKVKMLIDSCLKLNIKILTVPPSDQWIYGMPSLRQMKDLEIADLLQREAIVISNINISEQLKGKRILVTGAAGSIGSEIVRQIVKYRPQMLILCDQAESFLHEIQLEIEDMNFNIQIETFIGSIRDLNRMSIPFRKFRPEIVFHAAAYKHVPMMESHPTEAIMNNVIGTKNIADLAVMYESEKFVMVSTDKAVNPTNVMGASKRIAEMYVQSLHSYLNNFDADNHGRAINDRNSINENFKIPSKTKFITTRFGNVLDSNGSVIPLFRSQILKGGPVTVTHPDIMRYFMTIPEAVQLVLEAAVMGNGGEIFVFDMGLPVKINDLALKMIRLAGLIPGEDIQIVYTGLRPGEKLYEELLNDKEKTMETHHEKIKIAKVAPGSYSAMIKHVDELSRICEMQDNYQLVKKMKSVVLEYISNNSKYQKLDLVNLVSESA